METCWYVGDGGGRELSGARDAGITPILVTNALVPQAAGHRADPDDYTPQHQIPDLPDLLGLVGQLARSLAKRVSRQLLPGCVSPSQWSRPTSWQPNVLRVGSGAAPGNLHDVPNRVPQPRRVSGCRHDLPRRHLEHVRQPLPQDQPG